MKPNDIVCRRVPIAFIDEQATKEVVLPKVVEIMGNEFGWSQDRKTKELEEAIEGLVYMK